MLTANRQARQSVLDFLALGNACFYSYSALLHILGPSMMHPNSRFHAEKSSAELLYPPSSLILLFYSQ
jgi:hypothetical protein